MENSSDNTSQKKKKTMGRRRIEMKKIAKKSSLQVAFSKRRAGLFKKAAELSVLCDCEIAILVQSPAEKMYAFGQASADSTVQRFLTNGDSNCSGEKDRCSVSSSRKEYEVALKKIHLEKNNKSDQEKTEGVWFDMSIEGMGIDDLEEYVEGLQGLLGNVQNRLSEISKINNSINIDVEGMSKDIYSAVTRDPPNNWASSSSSNSKELVMVGDNHEMEKSSFMSSSVSNQYNNHGGSSSPSSLLMAKKDFDIFGGMSNDDICDIQTHCSSSSSNLKRLVGYNNEVSHAMERFSQPSEPVISSSVDNQYNDQHGGSSSSSSLLMAQNDDIFEGMSNYEVYAALTMDLQAAHCSPSPSLSSSSTLAMAQNNDVFDGMSIDDIYAALMMDLEAAHCSSSSSSSSSRIGGSSSSTLEMAQPQNDDHDPFPLLQNDESIEDLINWCHENIDFDSF